MCYVDATEEGPSGREMRLSTTNIRLPEDLKKRATRADFHDTAEKRFEAIMTSGKAIAWPEMRRYLENRAAGKRAVRPAVRRLMP